MDTFVGLYDPETGMSDTRLLGEYQHMWRELLQVAALLAVVTLFCLFELSANLVYVCSLRT